MRLTANQHIEWYMAYCQSKQLRPETMLSYECTLRMFEKWCQMEMEIDSFEDVTDNVIRRYTTDIQQRGMHKKAASVAAFLHMAQLSLRSL